MLADLSQDGLPPIVEAAGRLEAGSFTPQGGRLPVADIESLQDPVRQADEAFAAADQKLAAVETGGLVDAVGVRYDEVADQVADASSSLDAAQRAVQVLPTMLGAEGDRRFLMIFQNNAEIRATGGLPGAMSLVETRDGRLDDDPADWLRVSSRCLDEPVLPLTAEELDTFGVQLGTYMQDANFTPDFPRTAQLMAAHWARKDPTTLDGVISVDPVALSYLLEATGPVTVDGITLTPQNAVSELLNNTYLRLPDPEAQNAFFRRRRPRRVRPGVPGRRRPGHADPGPGPRRGRAPGARALLRGRRAGAAHRHRDRRRAPDRADRPPAGRRLLQRRHRVEDELLPRLPGRGDADLVPGRHPAAQRSPHDVLRTPRRRREPAAVDHRRRQTTASRRATQIVIADLFGPVDGTITKVRIDGKPAHAKVASFQGRPTTQLALFFESGQDVDITWQMDSGAGQTGDTDVWVTPGVQPERESSVAVSGCG